MIKRILLSLILGGMLSSCWAVDNFTATDINGNTIYLTSNSTSAPYVATVTYNTTTAPGTYSGDVVIPSTVEYNEHTYTVTTIGSNAFKNSTGLTSITIPSSITTMVTGAFSGCNSITTINYNATNLSTSYNYGQFSDSKTTITTINIGDNVTILPNYIFAGITHAFSVTIPASVTNLGNNTFRGSTGLTSVTLNEGLESIGQYAFYGCNNASFTSIDFPSTLTIIDNSAFENCNKLASVTIPASVTRIYGSAFKNCTGLTSVTLNEGLQTIGASAFYTCTNITTPLIIPSTVTSIGSQAFYRWEKTPSLTISSNSELTTINSQTFYQLKAITEINIPSNITSIGESAFYGCNNTGLTSIIIPQNVTSIANNAFASCSNLNDVYMLSTTPDGISLYGKDAFKKTWNSWSTIHVMKGYAAAYYGETNWSDLTIEEYTALTLANLDLTNSVTPLTIPSGVTITVTGTATNTKAANLVIEDGGQLILPKTSTGVQATVKKETYAATAKDAETYYYWFAISSAVANPNISSATNIASGTYDLYRYNEAATTTNAQGQILYWENYKAGHADFTTLEKGRGYLYRKTADLSIAMTGEINVADFNYSVTNSGGPLAGFNLIGNPYSHDIYKGAGTAIPNGTDFLRTGFYYMDPTTGKWTTGTDNSTAIKPNEAIFVQTDANGNITMTNTNASSSAKANNDNIMFKVANSQYSDEAYAWFDKGRGLNKISHRNAEVPMLYINQDGENYAIATMSDDIKTFSLNFKAMTMGKYTLSYKTKGEFNYLHVIDRFTGEDVDMLLEGEYSFVASPIDSDARFIVRLEYTSNNGTNDSSVFAYQSGNEIIVSGEGELQIFDVMGRKISTHQINGVETVNVNAHGVYIFKLNEKTQKIIIK